MKLNIGRHALAELGTIAVVHGQIEDELAELIIDLLGLSRNAGMILTAELSLGQRVAVISSMFLQALAKTHPMYVRLRRVLKAVGDAEAQRNTAMHAVWLVPTDANDPNDTLRVRRSAKARHGLIQDHRHLTLADLQAITEQQGRALADLALFRLAIANTALDGTALVSKDGALKVE